MNRGISKDEKDRRKLNGIAGNDNDGIITKEDTTGDEGSDAKLSSNAVFIEGEFINPQETRPVDDENVEFSGSRMEDSIEIGKDEGVLLSERTLIAGPERTSISEKRDQGLRHNEEVFPLKGNPHLPGHPKDQVISSTEGNPERIRYLTEVVHLETSDDKQPHKCPDISPQHFPLNSTPRLVSSDGQEMIEISGSEETSGIAVPMTRSQTHAKRHLHDQALLSDSWMTNKSFGMLEVPSRVGGWVG